MINIRFFGDLPARRAPNETICPQPTRPRPARAAPPGGLRTNSQLPKKVPVNVPWLQPAVPLAHLSPGFVVGLPITTPTRACFFAADTVGTEVAPRPPVAITAASERTMKRSLNTGRRLSECSGLVFTSREHQAAPEWDHLRVLSTRRFRSLALTVALLGVLAAGAVPAVAHQRTPAQRRNAGRAILQARRELDRLPLPAGTFRVLSLPGEPASFGSEPRLVGSRTVYRHRVWIVPRDPRQVFSWSESHSAWHFRHRSQFISGFFDEDEPGAGAGVGPRFAWRPGRHGVRGSKLSLEVDHVAGHRSVVRATAAVRWVKPRPAAERVPGRVARIAVSTTTWRGESRSPIFVPGVRVPGVIRIADRLRIYQGGEFCEELPELGAPQPPVVHIHFESAAGAVLAEASQRAGEGGCRGTRFVVRGRKMAPLQNGARLLRAVLPERRRLAVS